MIYSFQNFGQIGAAHYLWTFEGKAQLISHNPSPLPKQQTHLVVMLQHEDYGFPNFLLIHQNPVIHVFSTQRESDLHREISDKKSAFKTNNIEDKTNYKQNATEFSSTPPAVPSDRVSRDSSSTILPAFTLSNITLLFWGWHPIIYDKRLNYCYKRIVTGFILKIWEYYWRKRDKMENRKLKRFPVTSTEGRTCLTYRAIPDINPPPPTGTKIQSTSGQLSRISFL